MKNSTLDQVELFFGEATDTLCRVYARVARESESDCQQLGGTLVGPECHYGQTLPASYKLTDLGPGPTVLAETIVLDPCFWSPETPQLYRANLQLRRGAELLGEEERIFGIRRLGAHGRDLFFERKRYVLRAVECPEPLSADIEQAHATNTALFVFEADDELCRRASELGVLIVTRVDGELDRVVAEIRRLRRWPAVGVVVVAAKVDDARILQRERLNLILAQFIATESETPAEWANLAICPSELVARRASPWPLPVVAYHRAAQAGASVEHLRAECDLLQADLAKSGSFAGYLV